MRKAWIALFLVWVVAIPVKASELVAPEVPVTGEQLMPRNTDSFGEGLIQLVQNSVKRLLPNLQEASQSCGASIVSAMLFSVLPIISQRVDQMVAVPATVAVAATLFQQANSMIKLATETVRNILEYGKLLCQVMTAALAAQGGVSQSSALYIGTTFFITVLNSLIIQFLVPVIFFYLAFSVAFGAFGDTFMKKIADMIKNLMVWTFKLMIIIFSTYMTITGAVSGTTDLAALKTAKVVISSSVPVVGSILSDSSEAVLVSMKILKNSAGLYGMLAVLAVFADPFLKIGAHYLLWKLSSLFCGVLGESRISTLTDAFSSAMSLLLATVATGCVLVLISTVCFMKGAG